METVNMHEAKAHLYRLVARVQEGESVLISKAGKPVARLVPVEPEVRGRLPRLGFLKGQGSVPEDIKTPFAKEIEEMFYGAE